MSALTTYLTPPCMFCGGRSALRLSTVALQQWRDGVFIQDAFGDLTEDAREHIKSGSHPKCWDDAFGEDDDEE